MKNNNEHILVVDVGNSYTKIGVYEKDKEKSSLIVLFPTIRKLNMTKLTSKIKVFKKYNIKHSIVGSVVPNIKSVFLKTIKKVFDIEPYFINENSMFSFTMDETPKKELGDDLKALCEYCVSVNKNSIGISFGTAIAAVYLKDKHLQGVSITAGLGFGLDKLIEKASLLKKNKINKFSLSSYGTNTISALESGINNLRSGFVNNFYQQAKKENLKNDLKCIVTGGESYNINVDSLDYEINKESILIGFKKIYFLNN